MRGYTSLEGDHEHSRVPNWLMAFDTSQYWEGRGPFSTGINALA